MPLPKWRERVPGKQSLAKRMRADILNMDLVHPFGPVGASPSVTHDLKPDKPLGNPPRKDQWNDNPEVAAESTAPAARPRRERSRGDLVR